jgi:hypothetical protein
MGSAHTTTDYFSCKVIGSTVARLPVKIVCCSEMDFGTPPNRTVYFMYEWDPDI